MDHGRVEQERAHQEDEGAEAVGRLLEQLPHCDWLLCCGALACIAWVTHVATAPLAGRVAFE